MGNESLYSLKHPHEPQIPPILDGEGRCLVCRISILEKERDALKQQAELLKNLCVKDWRIGMAATPNMRNHYWFHTVGIIRRILPETPTIKEMLHVEIYQIGEPHVILYEPSDDWMTA